MNRKPLPPDDSWETDAVWKLLDAASPQAPGPRFVDDVVRAAKLDVAPAPWWKRLLSPAPLAGAAAATAAVVLAVMSLTGPDEGMHQTVDVEPAVESEQFAEIQDVAEVEILMAAVDQLDDFSDGELVSLIGF